MVGLYGFPASQNYRLRLHSLWVKELWILMLYVRSSESFSFLLCKFWVQMISVSRFYKSERRPAPPATFSLGRGRKPRSRRFAAGNSRNRPARPEGGSLPGERAQLWGVGRDGCENGSCDPGIAAKGTSTDRPLRAGWKTTSENKSREKQDNEQARCSG